MVLTATTIDSERMHLTVGPTIQTTCPITHDGALLPGATMRPSRIVEARNLTLSFGRYSGPAESLLVVRACQAAGIERMVTAHPSGTQVKIPLDVQKEAARQGAFPQGCPSGSRCPPRALSFDQFKAQFPEIRTRERHEKHRTHGTVSNCRYARTSLHAIRHASEGAGPAQPELA